MKSMIDTRSGDLVSELLAAVRVRTTVYCRSTMRAPWGFGIEAHGNPSFHGSRAGAAGSKSTGTGPPRG
jgi:hypothetical protein